MAFCALSPITPKSATGNGDLDGFKVSCSCGWDATASLLTLIQHDAQRHLDYMARKANAPERCRQCRRRMNAVEAVISPTCGKCCRKNHRATAGRA